MSQFADDTNLFCEDITSVDNALCLVDDFAPVSGLKLNVKKTKALWLGKWRNNRTTPLQLSWPRDPVKILGIYLLKLPTGRDITSKQRLFETHTLLLAIFSYGSLCVVKTETNTEKIN